MGKSPSAANKRTPSPQTDGKDSHGKMNKSLQEETDGVTQDQAPKTIGYERPKSKKELRAERKAAKKASAPKSAEEIKIEQRKLAKEKKNEEAKIAFKELLKQQRREKKLRQQKKANREKNSRKVDPSTKDSQKRKKTDGEPENNAEGAKKAKTMDDIDINKRILHEIKYGKKDSESDMVTLQSGVQYKDVVVGGGLLVQNRSLVTVQYKLSGGKFNAVIDSSKNFHFRMGKGEVIRGWELGVAGMREGGRRKLTVPPKVGYGAKDIGAGPGGLLHFDITVLNVR